MNWFWVGGLYVLCALLRHPPSTSAGSDALENQAERTANLMKMRGATMTVSCACGRKMVDPIWRPRWRPR